MTALRWRSEVIYPVRYNPANRLAASRQRRKALALPRWRLAAIPAVLPQIVARRDILQARRDQLFQAGRQAVQAQRFELAGESPALLDGAGEQGDLALPGSQRLPWIGGDFIAQRDQGQQAFRIFRCSRMSG